MSTAKGNNNTVSLNATAEGTTPARDLLNPRVTLCPGCRSVKENGRNGEAGTNRSMNAAIATPKGELSGYLINAVNLGLEHNGEAPKGKRGKRGTDHPEHYMEGSNAKAGPCPVINIVSPAIECE